MSGESPANPVAATPKRSAAPDNSSPTPLEAAAVVPARRLMAGRSNLVHCLSTEACRHDQEHEDGTKGREVGSNNDLNIHLQNFSYRRHPGGARGVVAAAAAESADSDPPGSYMTIVDADGHHWDGPLGEEGCSCAPAVAA